MSESELGLLSVERLKSELQFYTELVFLNIFLVTGNRPWMANSSLERLNNAKIDGIVLLSCPAPSSPKLAARLPALIISHLSRFLLGEIFQGRLRDAALPAAEDEARARKRQGCHNSLKCSLKRLGYPRGTPETEESRSENRQELPSSPSVQRSCGAPYASGTEGRRGRSALP